VYVGKNVYLCRGNRRPRGGVGGARIASSTSRTRITRKQKKQDIMKTALITGVTGQDGSYLSLDI
jgi:hypothetical protein